MAKATVKLPKPRKPRVTLTLTNAEALAIYRIVNHNTPSALPDDALRGQKIEAIWEALHGIFDGAAE